MAIQNLITIGDKRIVEVDANPSISGVQSDPASIALYNDNGIGRLFFKTGAESTDWDGLLTSTSIVLDDLNDIDIVDIEDGQVLVYDQSLGKWINTHTISGNKTFNDDVVINGNFIVNGTQTIVNSQTVEVEDNIILLNRNEPGPGVTANGGIAGIEISRGGETGYPNYFFVFQEDTKTFRVGEDGDLQAVATREDNPEDGGIAIWDNETKRFITSPALVMQVDGLFINSDINMASNRITNVSDPTNAQDVATKAYVDAQSGSAVTSLFDLTDTDLGTSPNNNDLLSYDSNIDKWVNRSIDDLGFVTSADLQDHIDDHDNPHQTSLGNLIDTNVASTNGGNILMYDADTGAWVATDTIVGPKTFIDNIEVNGNLTVGDGTATTLEVTAGVVEIIGNIRNQEFQANALLKADNNGNVVSSNVVAVDSADSAPLNMPILESDPQTIEDGDIWALDSNGIFWNVRANGVTYRVAMTSTGFPDFGQLGGVDFGEDIADNDILAYDAVSGNWTNNSREDLGLASQNDLDDHVNDTSIHFEKGDIELNDLGNVNVAGASDASALVYDSDTQTWVARIISAAGVAPGTAEGQILYWNAVEEEWDIANGIHWDEAQGRLGIGTDTPSDTIHIVGSTRLEGDVSIAGNLTVVGDTYQTHVEELLVENNEIIINRGEPGNGVTAGTAGIRVYRGGNAEYPDYLFIFEESSDTFRIGEDGDLQAVATREDNPEVGGIAFWNTIESRFDTSEDLMWLVGDNILVVNGIINVGQNRIVSVADPIDDQDVVTKSYLDASLGGVSDGLNEHIEDHNNPHQTRIINLADVDLGSGAADNDVLMYNSGTGMWSPVNAMTMIAGVPHQLAFYGEDGALTNAQGTNENALTWDQTNNRLGIRQTSPQAALHIHNTNTSGTVSESAVILGSIDQTSDIGNWAVITGFNNAASGNITLVGGEESIADGDHGLVFGRRLHTNGYDGVVLLGDSQAAISGAEEANSMKLRFENGLSLVKGTGTDNEDGVNYAVKQASATTAADGWTTVDAIVVPTNSAMLIEARVMGYVTGGSNGNVGDSAAFVRMARVKNVGGTITVDTVQSSYTSNDLYEGSESDRLDATIDISGPDVRIRVKGADNVNVTWHSTNIIQKIAE